MQPPWSSNWTANINIEMNYWPAETCNLSECAEPLFDLVHDLSHTGTRAAGETYDLPGWVTHHNIDLWGAANPVGQAARHYPRYPSNRQPGGQKARASDRHCGRANLRRGRCNTLVTVLVEEPEHGRPVGPERLPIPRRYGGVLVTPGA